MFTRPAYSLEKYLPLFDRLPRKVVLDYGSGNLRNSLFLHRRGYEVFAVDLPHKTRCKSLPRLTCVFPEDLLSINTKIGVTLCTFVLNQIPDSERIKVFETVAKKMVRGGYLLIETKGFSLFELDTLVIPRGFIRIHYQNGRYTLIALYQYN
ncbi:MAG: class I SAM-dependent methyltransferase [Eubacteriales bacterium]